jgi:hypothetical protein
MNTKTAVMERTRSIAPIASRVMPLYTKQLHALSDLGQGMGMTDWPVQTPADFAVGTATGTRQSCWE